MPGPLRLQSQDGLRYFGHDSGSRGPRHGYFLGSASGSRLRASPRYHAYVFGSPVRRPRRDGCGLALASQPTQPPVVPPRWAWVWLLSCLAVLSHIFLDWTNNYGIRPFFPFNPRWYSLDIAFIIEPVIFAALLLGLVIPAIFGLADREIGAGSLCSVAAVGPLARWYWLGST